MGLLDALFSDSQGSGGGLLDLIRNSAINQQIMPTGQASDQAQYGQPMNAMARMPQSFMQPPMQQPPQNGTPPQSAPMQPQYAPPQFSQPPAPSGFSGALNGFLGNLPAGPIGALIGAAGGAAGLQDPNVQIAQQRAAAQASFLRSHGVPELDIAAAVGNGRVPGDENTYKTLLANNVKEKQDYRPANAEERKNAGVVDGQPLFIETNTNKPMFGPAQTNVSTTINGEKEQDKTLGKGYGERQLEIQKAGFNAPTALGNLNLMEKLIKDPNFYSGFGGGVATKLKQMGVAAGIADASTAQPNELFDKLSKKSVLDAAGGSLGSGFSNGDRIFINGTVPNIENTPEGNKQIIEIGRQVHERNIEIAKQARAYAKDHNGRLDSGFEDQIAEYAAKNPLFANMGDKPSEKPAGPDMSQARKAPDGNTYVPDPARPGKYLKVTP